MGKKAKQQPSPQVPQRKQLPAPSAGEAKTCPKRLLGIDNEPDGRHPLWRLSLLDLEHTEGWSWTLDEADLRKIVTFLAQMERLTWTQVRALMTGGRRRGALHKFIPADHLCPIAQRRLVELKLDDFEELFRFRLGNLERLWGVIRDGVFYARSGGIRCIRCARGKTTTNPVLHGAGRGAAGGSRLKGRFAGASSVPPRPGCSCPLVARDCT